MRWLRDVAEPVDGESREDQVFVGVLVAGLVKDTDLSVR